MANSYIHELDEYEVRRVGQSLAEYAQQVRKQVLYWQQENQKQVELAIREEVQNWQDNAIRHLVRHRQLLYREVVNLRRIEAAKKNESQIEYTMLRSRHAAIEKLYRDIQRTMKRLDQMEGQG